MNSCLASRILPQAGLEHIAHDHLFHLAGFEVSPLQGCPNTNLAEFGGWHFGQATTICAYRGTHGTHNDRFLQFSHYDIFPFWLLKLSLCSAGGAMTCTLPQSGCTINRPPTVSLYAPTCKCHH